MVKGRYRYIAKELDLLIIKEYKLLNKKNKKKVSFKDASRKIARRLKR